jgi:threonine/homoserine/homoserine lactone efflux protein
MTSTFAGATLLNGFVLGWSVAWPPGPINAEMIRRSVLSSSKGGGFWSAWRLGLGACTGDFLWALGVAVGAGALLNTPGVRRVLGFISFALLLFLAFTFAVGAWRATQKNNSLGDNRAAIDRRENRSRGYLLGFTLALTSPWNIGFWLAVIGSQQTSGQNYTLFHSLTLAGAVVSGAIAWTLVLCLAVKQGARIFARPSWQVGSQAVSAVVMLWFAFRLVRQMFA